MDNENVLLHLEALSYALACALFQHLGPIHDSDNLHRAIWDVLFITQPYNIDLSAYQAKIVVKEAVERAYSACTHC